MKKYVLTIIFAVYSLYVFSMQKDSITQHPIEVYEWIDTCTTKYAVVYDTDGRCGIYNLENNKNLTELEYRQLSYTKEIDLENGDKANMFYGKKGRKKGVVSVSPDDDVMFVAIDDEDEFYSLDSCFCIDKKLTDFCRKTLQKNLTMIDSAVYGEILVMDARTAQLKTWIAMEDEYGSGAFRDAKLRKHQCSIIPIRNLNAYVSIVEAGLCLNDSVYAGPGMQKVGDMMLVDSHYLGETTYKEGFMKHSNVIMAKALYAAYGDNLKKFWVNTPRAINAMTLATVYTIMACDTSILFSESFKSEFFSLSYEEIRQDIKEYAVSKEVLKATLQEGGIGSKWTTKKVDLSGDYIQHPNCCPTLYDENSYEIDRWRKEHFQNYNQIIFTGYLPSDNPRYTICISVDTKTSNYSREISYMVNKVAEYLNRHSKNIL